MSDTEKEQSSTQQTPGTERDLPPRSSRVYVFPEETVFGGVQPRRPIPPHLAGEVAARERGLGAESGQQLTNAERGLRGQATQSANSYRGLSDRGATVVNVPREEAIRIGTQPRREVPPHIDARLDEQLATVERATRSGLADRPTNFLIRTALAKDNYLLHPPSPLGPLTQRATAETLILIYNILENRLHEAPIDRHGRPVVEGISWDIDDPLGGNLSGVSPFGNLDMWTRLSSESPERRTHPTPPPPPPSPRECPTPTPRISWYYQPPANEPPFPSGSTPPPPVGTTIELRDVGNTDQSSLRYEWLIVRRPSESRAVIVNRTAPTTTFRIDQEGTYTIWLNVRNQCNRGARDQVNISTRGVQPPPEPTPDPLPEDRVVDEYIRLAIQCIRARRGMANTEKERIIHWLSMLLTPLPRDDSDLYLSQGRVEQYVYYDGYTWVPVDVRATHLRHHVVLGVKEEIRQYPRRDPNFCVNRTQFIQRIISLDRAIREGIGAINRCYNQVQMMTDIIHGRENNETRRIRNLSNWLQERQNDPGSIYWCFRPSR
jgi:hypothetical protein